MKKSLPDHDKRFREARCEEVKDYLPAVRLKDFPGLGPSTYSALSPDKAVHLTVSGIESRCFYALCFDGRAAEIRTQYPLEKKKTMAIAKSLNYRHPMIPGTKMENLMTTDMYVLLRNGKNVALYIKPKHKLKNKRVREKLQIEANYWRNEGIKFLIITEDSISLTKGSNCEYLLHTQKPDKALLELAPEYKQRLYSPWRSVLEISNDFDKEFNLMEGSGLHLFHYLVAVHELPFDMEQDILKPEEIYYAH